MLRKKFCQSYIRQLFDKGLTCFDYSNYSKSLYYFNRAYVLAEFFEGIWPKEKYRWRDYRSTAYRLAEEARQQIKEGKEELEEWLLTYTEQ